MNKYLVSKNILIPEPLFFSSARAWALHQEDQRQTQMAPDCRQAGSNS